MRTFEEFCQFAKRHRQEATKWYARVGPKAGDWETVTVGTASGWLGVGPDDYFELNDALGGPHAQVNGHRGRASIQALEAFVERLAPHLTGKYGGEEIPKIIDMHKAVKLDTGGSARSSATQAGTAREPVRSPSPAPAANPPSAKKAASQPNVVVQTQAPASEEGQHATALFRQWNSDPALRARYGNNCSAFLAATERGDANGAPAVALASELNVDKRFNEAAARARWAANKDLRAEFGDRLDAFLAYERAVAFGHIKRVPSHPRRAHQTPTPQVSAKEDLTIDGRARNAWRNHPSLRAEFGSLNEFTAFVRAVANGQIHGCGSVADALRPRSRVA